MDQAGKRLLSHPWIESAITLVAIVMQFSLGHRSQLRIVVLALDRFHLSLSPFAMGRESVHLSKFDE